MRLPHRNKLFAVCFSTMVFTGSMVIFVIIVGGALGRAMIIVPIIGFVISLFEIEIYPFRATQFTRANKCLGDKL